MKTTTEKKPTQKERIKDYINRFGSISPLEAFRDLGITKLATRVSEMKRDGMVFHTEFETGKNRFGEKTHYARYSWRKETNER